MPRSLKRHFLARKYFQRQPTATHTLHLRNIYILPTKTGGMLLATLLLLLVTSINFQLNLGYALTFLIVGAAFASTFSAYRTLKSLNFSLLRAPEVFAGDDLSFTVQANSIEERKHFGIGIAINQAAQKKSQKHWAWFDVLPKEIVLISLSAATKERGWQNLPELTIMTQFPLGVFRAWSIWQPARKILVYPEIEKNAPALSTTNTLNTPDLKQNSAIQSTKKIGSEIDTIRPYRAGDAIKQIYWKKIQPDGTLFTKEMSTLQSQDCWLTLNLTGLTRLEAQISRLTAWVLEAESLQQPYGMQLGNDVLIPPSNGSSHQRQCLEALATFKKGF